MVEFWRYMDYYGENSVWHIKKVEDLLEYILSYEITPQLLKFAKPLSEKQISFIAYNFDSDQNFDELKSDIKKTSRLIGEKIDELKRNSKIKKQDYDLFKNYDVNIDLDQMDISENDKHMIKLLIESENMFYTACNLEKGKRKIFKQRKEILKKLRLLASRSGKYENSLYGEAMLYKLDLFEDPVIVRYYFTNKEYKWIHDYVEDDEDEDEEESDEEKKDGYEKPISLETKIDKEVKYLTIGQMVRFLKSNLNNQ